MDRSALPTSVEELRRSLGDPRVVAALAVALVVVVVGFWGLFVHQPGPATPGEPPFAAADPPAPTDGSYRVVGRVTVSGQSETLFVERVRTYVPGDPDVALERWTFGGADDQTTVVHYAEGTTDYTRQTWLNGTRYRQQYDARSGEEEFVRANNETRTIYTRGEDEEGVRAEPPGGIALSVLAQLPYERAGTTTYEGREVVRYRPTTGWANRQAGAGGVETVHVTAASGEVLVDPSTDAVLYADVDATLTQSDTWAEALASNGVRHEVQYRVDTDVDRPRAPPWVETLRERATVRDRAVL